MTPCIPHTGAFNGNGYGHAERNGIQMNAHRAAWIDRYGPIPEGLVVDHLCRNKACVNTDHLEPVTNRENLLRGVGFAATKAKQTHCIHGHSLADAIRRKNGTRRCRSCVRVWNHEQYLKRRAAA
jgi:hypothetical protein